jgi:CrcB protein
MQLEILVLLDHDRYGLAAGYALTSITAGYLAIWIGTALVRRERGDA